MPVLETAALFVSTISALSAVVQAVKTAKELTDDDIFRAEEIAKPNLQNASVLALVDTGIDPEYIEIAQKNIERALKRFKQVLRDPSSPQAVKDQEEEAAQYVVCSELRRLMRLNVGVLPGDDSFHELWSVHQCDEIAT